MLKNPKTKKRRCLQGLTYSSQLNAIYIYKAIENNFKS